MSEPDLDRFTSRRSTVYAPRGVVATSQPLAAEAGVSILRSGGNAFDAAVATAAALNIVEPTHTGLGGDVFALYRTADGEVGAMRSCGGAPTNATLNRVRNALAAEQGVDPADASMPKESAHAVTVPGTARGWEATVERLGTQTLEEVLQPAIEYAMEGYPVSEVIADAWKSGEELFTDDHARAAYLVDGERAPRVGENVHMPELGETMRTIAERGADVVYEGEIAQQIADEVQSKGGFLSVDDLASFEPEFVEPVSATYRGVDVYELPPNNQGLIALEALKIAEEIDAGSEPYSSPERIHKFAESMKLAFHDGHHYITDPKYEEIPPLADESYARERAKAVGRDPIEDINGGIGEDGDTVLLTVADDEGNLVSYINSRFAGFGSGLVAGDTGIALQNRGWSFSLDPEHPNRIEPEKRPFHTLIPAVARLDADDWLAFGVMGGFMQPQGHVQVLSNIVDYDMPLQLALDEPRWRYRESGRLALEGRFDGNLVTKLARRGHDVTMLPPSEFGGGQMARDNGGTLSAATEPRKDGTASGY